MAMSRTKKTLLIIGGILFAFLLIGIIGIVLIAESIGKPKVAENSVLVLKVSGTMPDYAPDDPMAKIFGVNQPQSFSSLLTQLRKAKVDKRVNALLLDIDFSAIGWGKAGELREAVADFKKSGKPVYAYMEYGGNKEYYIATVADKIYLPPPGELGIIGLQAQAQFYKGSLDKLGIEIESVAIGKYKGANDPLVRKDLSPEQREVLNALLDDYYNRLVNTIAEARKKSPEDVKAIIDNAPYTAPQAHQQNLIDGTKYRDELYNEIKQQLGYKETENLRTTSASSYKEITPESLGLNNGERIAVIFASGLITTGKSSEGNFSSSQTMGSDTMVRAIKDAADDDSIKAIVLRVDSGGGSALASDLMWHTLEYAKTKKPVVTSMGDVAASGGYYIACNSNKIVAEPATITGSIGVILGRPVVKGFYDWVGISNEYLTRGKNAGLLRDTEKWTDEQRAKVEEAAKFIYWDNFVPKVAKGRNKSIEQVHEIAQGRVWTGAQAKERGLIDEFGGLNRAIEIAKELANLPADKDVKRVVFPIPRPFLQSLFGGDDDEATIRARQQEALIEALPEDAQKVFSKALLFDQFKRGETLALIPFELEVK
jgi:protease IV